MTTQHAPITSKNFNRKLGDVLKSARSMRDNLQELLVFALEHYAESVDANCGYLNRIVNGAIETKGINDKQMRSYVSAAANVSWSKHKDGKAGFKKSADAKGAPAQIDRELLDTAKWYDYNKPKAEEKFRNFNGESRAEKFYLASPQQLKTEVENVKAYLRALEDYMKPKATAPDSAGKADKADKSEKAA